MKDVPNIYCLRPQDRIESVKIGKDWIKIRKQGFNLALRYCKTADKTQGKSYEIGKVLLSRINSLGETSMITRFGTSYVALSRFEKYYKVMLQPFSLPEFLKINDNNSIKPFRDYINEIKKKEHFFLENCKNKN